ncbi:hypothetical protein HYH02_005522 [Chlamydomonas schloesseri]|uniref:Uncharacterized protein n=1 Tax=Chlamydomonas schloesseri TaxID=2026947 RepID=A0A835WKI1_9CHLO|nr:hypothetical protein HYH02_005522 [Chlamydomonas schloesseri]|eukprot:KAG2449369.1 hypothetical protein HYH02_005522 [Chlamydomonas schloesseri]
MLAAPPLLLHALLLEHKSNARNALNSLITRAPILVRWGRAPTTCVGRVAAALGEEALTQHGVDPGFGLDVMGKVVLEPRPATASAGGSTDGEAGTAAADEAAASAVATAEAQAGGSAVGNAEGSASAAGATAGAPSISETEARSGASVHATGYEELVKGAGSAAAAIAASLRSHGPFMSKVAAAVPEVLRGAGVHLQHLQEPATALRALAAASVDRSIVSSHRIAGAATYLASAVYAQHGDEAAAERAQLCCATLAEVCKAAQQGKSVTAHVPRLAEGPAAELLRRGATVREASAGQVLAAVFAHTDLVAAALAAPGAGATLLHTLCDVCEQVPYACAAASRAVVEAMLAHGSVMQAVIAAPSASAGLTCALQLACSLTSGEGQMQVVEVMLKHAGLMRCALSTREGVRCLVLALAGASRNGNLRAINALLSEQAVRDALLAGADRSAAGELAAALRSACGAGDSKAVGAMLSHELLVDAVLMAPQAEEALLAALCAACAKGDTGVVAKLLACRRLMDPVLTTAAPPSKLADRGHELACLVRDACTRPRADQVVRLLLGDAAFTQCLHAGWEAAAVAGSGGLVGRWLAAALYHVSREVREGAVTALLANRTFRAAALDAAPDGTVGVMIGALCLACESSVERHAAVVQVLLADAGFV